METPVIVAVKPIVKPVRKKIFVIEFLLMPKVLKTAISFVLFFIICHFSVNSYEYIIHE